MTELPSRITSVLEVIAETWDPNQELRSACQAYREAADQLLKELQEQEIVSPQRRNLSRSEMEKLMEEFRLTDWSWPEIEDKK